MVLSDCHPDFLFVHSCKKKSAMEKYDIKMVSTWYGAHIVWYETTPIGSEKCTQHQQCLALFNSSSDKKPRIALELCDLVGQKIWYGTKDMMCYDMVWYDMW